MPLDNRKPGAPDKGATTHGRAMPAQATRVADNGDDARRFRIAASSEFPVERWYGDEILSHEREAIDLEFFGSGRAPVLLDHDPTRQIGVVEKVSLDNDRVLRAVIRFGKGAEASAIMADVEDRIRGNVSVGYRINDFKPLPKDAGYRITDWTPMEVSIVSIPADSSVGVGRSDQVITKPNENRIRSMEDNSETIESGGGDRVGAVLDMTDLAERHNLSADFKRWLTPERRQLPAKEIRAQATEFVLRNLPQHRPIGRPVTSDRFGSPAIHTENRTYSLGAVVAAQVTGDWRKAGFEREVSQEIAGQMGQSARGLYVPPVALVERATLASSDVSAMFGTDHMDGLFIEAIKKRLAVGALGVTMLTGLSRDVSIPKWVSGSATQWVAEDSAPTDSDPDTASVALTYHQLSTTAKWSRKVAVQAHPDMEDTMRRDMLREIAVAVERAAITGTAADNQPRGILNTVGVGAVAFGTTGGPISWAKVLEFIGSVEGEDIHDGNFGFLINTATKIAMMSTERAEGTAKFIMDDANVGRLAGYRVEVTNAVPSNLTKSTGTDLSAMIFGRWSDLFIGQFAGIDVIVDPYTESAKGNVRITAHSSWDIAVRHAESFAGAKDIDTSGA